MEDLGTGNRSNLPHPFFMVSRCASSFLLGRYINIEQCMALMAENCDGRCKDSKLVFLWPVGCELIHLFGCLFFKGRLYSLAM